MHQFKSKFLSTLKAALFIAMLVLVLFLIWLSDGRVLDIRIAASNRSLTLLAISVVSWAILLVFAVRLTIGRWKSWINLKRAILMGAIAGPAMQVVFDLLPFATPKWVGALFVGAVALAAAYIANRIIPLAGTTQPTFTSDGFQTGGASD
ncbi:hypothetical protein [Novosphingobium sp. LASN5T]|uniref:hypothetical protein n=2 Tax=unclassified Novosphingobium TaxID=2644732 RepID=UPI000F5FF040|nr:hypothetical protein [Novosphingobium sp. LASN5T]MBF5092892.1 hypothetical protein [Novosphingobium sp. NBM11]RQW44776.1 hypothetical protein EH199_07145 [Novosphingobium sp. LASN5T]